MPTFIVKHPTLSAAMKVVGKSIMFITDARNANSYPSKYAAKKHLRMLDNVPEGVKIIELVDLTNGVNLNG